MIWSTILWHFEDKKSKGLRSALSVTWEYFDRDGKSSSRRNSWHGWMRYLLSHYIEGLATVPLLIGLIYKLIKWILLHRSCNVMPHGWESPNIARKGHSLDTQEDPVWETAEGNVSAKGGLLSLDWHCCLNQRCQACQEIKEQNQRQQELLWILPVPRGPLEEINSNLMQKCYDTQKMVCWFTHHAFRL